MVDNWYEKMQTAVDYMEGNLSSSINLEKAAEIAKCSKYHFIRFFSYIAGYGPAEYIRRRRLTMAGYQLQHSQLPITRIAADHGYDNVQSFSRAFEAFHGVLPSQARVVDVKLESCPYMKIVPHNHETDLTCTIVTSGSFFVFGCSITMVPGSVEEVTAFWNECEEKRITNRMVEAAGGSKDMLLNGAIFYNADSVKYMLYLCEPAGGVPKDFDRIVIPARTWAVFSMEIKTPGEDHVTMLEKRVRDEWFPNVEYIPDEGPQLEKHRWNSKGRMVCEVWFPVRRKKRGNIWSIDDCK